MGFAQSAAVQMVLFAMLGAWIFRRMHFYVVMGTDTPIPLYTQCMETELGGSRIWNKLNISPAALESIIDRLETHSKTTLSWNRMFLTPVDKQRIQEHLESLYGSTLSVKQEQPEHATKTAQNGALPS